MLEVREVRVLGWESREGGWEVGDGEGRRKGWIARGGKVGFSGESGICRFSVVSVRGLQEHDAGE